MKKKFKCEIGFSDHSLGIVPAITSVALGATVIEKHFKINEKGLDSKFSIGEKEFQNLVDGCKIAKLSYGRKFLGISKSESNSVKYKRSLYLVKNVKKGEKITSDHIKSIRGGYGDDPIKLKKYIGLRARRDFKFPLALKLKYFI